MKDKTKEEKIRTGIYSDLPGGLYFCGDIHGDYKEFIWNITKRYKIRDSVILELGDFGIGFNNTMDDLYSWSEKRLEDTGNVVVVIRGNHDDPEYFTNEEKYSFPRLKFLEDHQVYNLAGRTVYTIGGANSKDISFRLEDNQKLASSGKSNRVWWEGEDIVKKYEDLPDKVDVIVSHSAPLSFMPVICKYSETPEYQYDKILEERRYLNHVLTEVNAKYWLYGHYHDHYSGTFGDLLYRGLGIMEFYECPEIIEKNPQGEEKENE